MFWRPEDVDQEYAANTRIFHYGSISLIHEPGRNATLTALNYASKRGALLTYDPNLRLSLWSSPAIARAGILDGWQYAEVIKVSEEELAFLSEKEPLEHAARSLWQEHLRLLVVTHGAAGCTYFTPDSSGHVPAFAVRALDTTGAGDAFMAGLLAGLLAGNLGWEQANIEHALLLGNAGGALSTTQLGAISSLPTLENVQAFLQRAGNMDAFPTTG